VRHPRLAAGVAEPVAARQRWSGEQFAKLAARLAAHPPSPFEDARRVTAAGAALGVVAGASAWLVLSTAMATLQ
jgi:hypothetical protein